MLNSYANFALKKTRWPSLFHAPILWWWVKMWCVLVNKKAVTIHSFWAEWQWKMTVPSSRCSDNSMCTMHLRVPKVDKNIVYQYAIDVPIWTSDETFLSNSQLKPSNWWSSLFVYRNVTANINRAAGESCKPCDAIFLPDRMSVNWPRGMATTQHYHKGRILFLWAQVIPMPPITQ